MSTRSALLHTREHPTEGIISLLESVTLGTNGAHYKHLDTRWRIKELDAPLFLILERNNKVYGNITFCKRSNNWYIRYFAFDALVQSGGKKKSKGTSGGIKKELNDFFESALSSGGEERVDSFYAYIDPRNAKSLWMSENFGFETVGVIGTQTFSRRSPKASGRVERIDSWETVAELIQHTFSDQRFFFTAQTKKPPFYVIKNEEGEIIASAKTSVANWEIRRLPGKFGGKLVKWIPYIPVVRKLIRPKQHTFIVPEAVYVEDNCPLLFEELFEGILALESKNLIIWWVDFHDSLYAAIREKVKWGLLHKLLGVNEVNVVAKSLNHARSREEKSIYTSGFDFI